MNKSGNEFAKKGAALFASLLVAVVVAACGSKQSAPAVADQTGAEQPAAQTAPADTQPSESTTGQPTTGEPAAQPAEAVQPAESISETDDGGQETKEPVATTVQPSLRLGGAATTAPTSAQFTEGKNYVRLVPAQPTTVGPDKVEVVEVFWYGCGHCFALDPALESWRNKSKPAYAQFVRVPAMWNETTRMHARIFFTAELLGKLEELHTPIFREINVKGNQLNTVEKISAFFKEHGVSTDDFQKAFSSFAVENKLQRADFLNRRYRIESVPTLIVNGKYKTDVSMAGGEQQLFGLIGELTAHEHGG